MSVIHIHRVETREIRRESAGEKWCFHCRKRLPHDYVVHAPAQRSYYGPNWLYECSNCGQDAIDFPGQVSERGWADED